MCLTPQILKDRTAVACRGCRLCRDNRLNDLVGRCIAEQWTATKTFAVTLTYAEDVPNSAVLCYQDIQRMLWLLRAKKGGNFNVRYICAGEYGTKKGRAHWHIILFFYGKYPDINIDERINWRYWPHGFAYFQNPDYKGFRYVMKYALKQDGNDGAQKALSMSKKPPLGYQFFMELADDMVERRLPVHSPEYSFAHVVDKDGKPRRYWLQGRMREKFLDRYYSMWRMQYGDEPAWSDFLLEKYLDPIERKRMELDVSRIERDAEIRQARYQAQIQAQATREFWADQASKRQQIAILCLSPGSGDIITVYSNDTAEVWLGDDKWQVTAGNVTVADQLLRGGLPKSKVQRVSDYLEAQWRNHRDRLSKSPEWLRKSQGVRSSSVT